MCEAVHTAQAIAWKAPRINSVKFSKGSHDTVLKRKTERKQQAFGIF